MPDRRRALSPLLIAMAMLYAGPAVAIDFADAEKLYRSGKYAEVIDAATKTIDVGDGDEDWHRLKIRAELASGKYVDALKSYEAAVDRYDRSVILRLLGHEVLKYNDKPDDAAEALAWIQVIAERAPWRYTDAASRVAVGKSLLLSGADARQVLELFYDKAKAESPLAVEPFIASGELALEKHDYALAAKEFAEAAKRSPDDADIQFGLARAYPNDEDRANAALTKALEINPKHVETLLYQADNAIDREGYGPAEELLKKVLEVNPKHARAWAYRAVLAHLNGDAKKEEAHRTEALSTWKTNPEIDHLIGSKLSAKYRFAEGAAYQRRALEFSASYKPAKVQLCQDLLRLGKDEEGWKLAAEASKEDPYNVVTFNLVTLHDRLSKFKTLQNDHFIVRMDQREAQIYGDRVMRLLERSREKLNAKYGANITTPVTIEIFPQQKDFAIRTFGLPGGAGFLGVCFGPVITVNSPQSRMASPNNWEAIVWHEYCHAVTLHKTRNKMPRWLSEGISVYEERQENPAWGQVMTPQYRDLILAGGATPVSQLSGAFLSPPTPMHLQFAYYESSMVVDYIVGRFGMSAIVKVLEDLGRDIPINTALAKHTEPIDRLDESFAAWLKDKATNLAPAADLKRPEGLALDADSAAMAAWNKDHPDNFWGLLGEGRALLAERKFEEAKKPLTRAAELYPGFSQPGGPFLLLAAAHRELKETKLERAMLERHVALDADVIEPRLRLMEIAAEEKDWPSLRKYAEEVLATNPLVPRLTATSPRPPSPSTSGRSPSKPSARSCSSTPSTALTSTTAWPSSSTKRSSSPPPAARSSRPSKKPRATAPPTNCFWTSSAKWNPTAVPPRAPPPGRPRCRRPHHELWCRL